MFPRCRVKSITLFKKTTTQKSCLSLTFQQGRIDLPLNLAIAFLFPAFDPRPYMERKHFYFKYQILTLKSTEHLFMKNSLAHSFLRNSPSPSKKPCSIISTAKRGILFRTMYPCGLRLFVVGHVTPDRS